MSDAPEAGAGGGLLPPPEQWWDESGAHATARPGGLVLEFPVEVEIRLVSPDRPPDTTIQRLTAALEGLA
ncbi:hypothetical protein [Amycolatopsis sp. NPDC004625]|uniref:hypothetical protein n=1 Tax=Amycolatopsis sp. NPDC004625 TaxID=3154670 RepID=UPI0033AC4D59